MKRKLKYDLHTHTSYSDGDLNISGNVENAIKLGLDGIAITDHDNIDGWEEIDNNSYKIDVIKGVELSTYYKGDSVHILGYYLNDNGDYSELDEFLKNTREERLVRVKKIIELLKQYDINVTYEEILKEADGAVARPHIVKAIMKKYPERGYTSNYLFDNYLGNDKPCFLPVNYFDTRDAIELLKRNHCLVVVAHPLLINKFNYQELAKYNIDGIYAFDPTWDRKREDEYINNYKYFAMPFNDSERDAPSELFEKTNLTLEELKEITSYDYKTEYIACDKMLYLEKMFKFILGII